MIVGGLAVENSWLAAARAEQAQIAQESYEAARGALNAESQRAEERSRVADFQSAAVRCLDPESLSPAYAWPSSRVSSPRRPRRSAEPSPGST